VFGLALGFVGLLALSMAAFVSRRRSR
jgi:hypothetical protein